MTEEHELIVEWFSGLCRDDKADFIKLLADMLVDTGDNPSEVANLIKPTLH